MVSAIIMASGFSRRMGENKLLMKYNNKFLIEYTLDVIYKCSFNDKVIVTQYKRIKEIGEKLNFKVVINKYPNKGQSESIKLGIKNCKESNGYMFFVGDQPLLNKDDIEKLIDVFNEDTNYIVIPKYKECCGNPVIYPKKYKKDILNLEGDKGGKSIIKSSDKIKYVNVCENTLFDIDDIDDFNNLLKRGKTNMNNDIVVVRGGGDIATGTIHKLYRCGFKIVILEIENPSSIRRAVCFSEAIYDEKTMVENVVCEKANNIDEIHNILNKGNIPIIIDPNGEYIKNIKPLVVVDAILAKKNLGTNKNMAPITIALGPGFCASKDVDIVIETMRGHNLGRIIEKGYARENTGTPGEIKGVSKERVIYSYTSGTISNVKNIGDIVKKGETIAYIDNTEVKATIDGVLRGIIRDKSNIKSNLKIADIDPREDEVKNSFTISDKARTVAGGVLEAILYLKQKQEEK